MGAVAAVVTTRHPGSWNVTMGIGIGTCIGIPIEFVGMDGIEIGLDMLDKFSWFLDNPSCTDLTVDFLHLFWQ